MAERFRNLVGSSSDIVAALDPSGTLTDINPDIQPTLGLPPADMIGQVLWELVHPDDVAAVHAAVKGVFDEGGPRSFQFQIPDSGGRWRRLEAVLALTGDAALEAVLSAVEVTSPAPEVPDVHNQHLRQAQKMEVVGRFAGGISHDFGNLLTVIIGASGHVLDGLPDESPLRPHAESIRTTAERAASMVRQLLAFSRQGREMTSVINVNDVVRETEELLRRLLGGHIEFRTIYGPDPWPIKADRTQLEQVLLNLAANARDAMPSGGDLTIETMNVGMSDNGGAASVPCAVVKMTDNGVGMDASTQGRAFEPFFTTKPPASGTGLGLATVQAILAQHGGWTRLESTLGQGTTVIFGLPRVFDTVTTTAAPATEPVRGGTETLLVVEDEDGVRELVTDMLTLAGYRVFEAAKPSEAEQISAELDGTIHMLLTDVVMPEMSGIELADRIRTKRPGLSVMYMSGFPEPMIGDGVGTHRPAHFVSKPFDRPTLLRAVRRVLDTAAMP